MLTTFARKISSTFYTCFLLLTMRTLRWIIWISFRMAAMLFIWRKRWSFRMLTILMLMLFQFFFCLITITFRIIWCTIFILGNWFILIWVLCTYVRWLIFILFFLQNVLLLYSSLWRNEDNDFTFQYNIKLVTLFTVFDDWFTFLTSF